MQANFPSQCPLCHQTIERGDEIARHNRRDAFAHVECLPASSRCEKAGFRVEIIASDSADYPVGRAWQYVHRGVAQSTLDAVVANTTRNGVHVVLTLTPLFCD